MNLLFRSLLKRGCKGKPFFLILQNFFSKNFPEARRPGKFPKNTRWSIAEADFSQNQRPDRDAHFSNGIAKVLLFSVSPNLFETFFNSTGRKNTDKTRNALEDRRLRKQKFSHKKTADGGTEGWREPGGAKDRKPPARHTGKEREGRTEEEED